MADKGKLAGIVRLEDLGNLELLNKVAAETRQRNRAARLKERFTDQLRRTVKASDLGGDETSRLTGIPLGVLRRFANRGEGLSFNIDRLCECLGLQLKR